MSTKSILNSLQHLQFEKLSYMYMYYPNMRYPQTAEMQESKSHKLRTRHGYYEKQRDKRAFDTTAQDNNVISDHGNQNRRER